MLAIPASRDTATWWQLPLWALFGNDEAGLYGERSGVPGFDFAQGGSPTTAQQLRWWLRNPAHNLFFHVLNWTPETTRLLGIKPLIFRWGAWDGRGEIEQGFRGYIGFRPRLNHPDHVFGIAIRL